MRTTRSGCSSSGPTISSPSRSAPARGRHGSKRSSVAAASPPAPPRWPMRPSPAALPTADAALALIKPRVRALAAYTLQAPEARRKLNQNESPFDVPAAIKDAVWARVREAPWNRYPSFTPVELLARLAERHGWTADGVLVGNGSNELIQATLAVTVAEGSVVVTPVPTFTLYRLLSEVYGGRHVGVPLTADFGFDIPALIRAA